MMRNPRPQPRYQPGRPVIPVEGLRGRDGLPYLPDPRLIAAINAAIVLGRPLLLTGEPGCGKTEFAWAVAHAIDDQRPSQEGGPHGLLECHVRSDSRARDLLYHYDALHRFGDAHHAEGRVRHHSTDPRNYLQLLPLGEALVAPHRQVVLIDEIDKAPRDLPNDLLRELEAGEFEIPELRRVEPHDADTSKSPRTRWAQSYTRVMRPENPRAPKPVVIITSNVERQLPDPFLRRCIFFHISFPDKQRLTEIIRARANEVPYLDRAVELFLTLRDVPRLTKYPATSELIDWVTELRDLYVQKDVEKSLDLMAGAIGTDAQGKRKLDRLKALWRDLPGMHCLLKLREDLQAIGC